MDKIEIIALESDRGTRIDVFLTQNLDGFSRNSVQKMLSLGNVKHFDKILSKNYKISGDEVLEITLPALVEMNIEAEDIPLDIIYEDDDICVINKPKGMVVHPAPGHFSGTLVNALMHHCKGSLSGINGEIRPGIVHRIDKNTTGLLVVAKNDTAHKNLSEQIKAHSAKRIYEGIVFGNIREDSGMIDKPIGRHKFDRKKMSINDKNGREAITHFKVIARYVGFTHMEFSLETGRTHQIRVHLESVGHPILGDVEYSNRECKIKTSGQCLHARKLVLVHPTTNEEMTFVAELPDYFKDLLEKIKNAR